MVSWLDVVVLLIVVISAVIGVARGFIKEAVALITWIAAIWLAVAFSGTLAEWLPESLERARFSLGGTEFEITNMRVGIACIGIIVVILVAGATVNYLLGKITRAQVLKGADRFLGLMFGVARGLAIVLMMVIAAGVTNAPKSNWWQEAALIPPFERGAVHVLALLPRDLAQHFSFGEQV
jgi:membrane protein required for colicin V production